MKTQLLNLTKSILAVGLTLGSFAQLNAQCSVITSVAYNAPGEYLSTTIPNVPSNWEQHITIDFGDGTSGDTYNGTANSYDGYHVYTSNGTYIVATYMSAYDPADTSINCNIYDFDTLVVSNVPCSIVVSNITATQAGSIYDYSFYSSYVSGNPGVQTSWVVKDTMGNILTTLIAPDNTNFTFSFQQSGYYTINFAAFAYDSLTASSCSDSTSLGMHVGNNQTTTCNASFYLWEDSTNIGQWNAINNSTGFGAPSYTWDFGDGSTSSLPYPTHTYAVPGNYVICLTVADNYGCASAMCDSTSGLRISQQQAINSQMGSLTVLAPQVGIAENKSIVVETKVFPNPMTDVTNVLFNSSIDFNGKVEIVNVLGAILVSESVMISRGYNVVKLNTYVLGNGVYYVNIVYENKSVKTVKAIK